MRLTHLTRSADGFISFLRDDLLALLADYQIIPLAHYFNGATISPGFSSLAPSTITCSPTCNPLVISA